jgi:hypothetical protein
MPFVSRTENRSPRTTILRIAAALLAVLVLGILVVLVHPVLLTGRYYELTIHSVEFDPEGLVNLTYDDAICYGTSIFLKSSSSATSEISTGGELESWESRRGGVLRWPRKKQAQVLGFWLVTDEERAKGIADSPAARQRLLLKEGTYRIRQGDRLIYYRRQEPNGTVTSRFIEARPTP